MRDKLKQKIEKALEAGFSNHIPLTSGYLADRLLANGVILLPCNVGDTVYYIAGKKVYKSKCHAITLQPSVQVHLYDYDGDNARYSTKEVFLTKKEAEKALKARANNE